MNCTILALYVLLPAKSEQCYNMLFNAMKDLQERLNPQTIMCDFELAAVNVTRANFLDANITECFFHLSQCLWRKIQTLGYTAAYQEENGEFATWARCILSLAFVPVDGVVASFETLIANNDFHRVVGERAPDLVDYFENTWIDRPHRQRAVGRKNPPFPIRLWNVRGRTIQGLGRTNNIIEGWHHKMNKLEGIRAPNLFI
ncbi:uncharacterized protein LOC143258255 [Tachypleus tridentatus]|uniref:uncharacterized protein LOC143258255 n=1 Tax=Tachypleus tridentatus TaxID=6853 RepID=UPI003FD01F32